jgi:hypothetical protein
MALKLNDTFKHIAGKPGAYRNRQTLMMLERWEKWFWQWWNQRSAWTPGSPTYGCNKSP